MEIRGFVYNGNSYIGSRVSPTLSVMREMFSEHSTNLQQEPKLTAFISQDANMIQAFQDGKDIYATIASLAFNCRYDECLEFTSAGEYNPTGKARRNEAKTVVLGILYGRSIPSIADQLYSKEAWSDAEKIKQAERVYQSVLNAFPALRQLMINSQKFAQQHGYVETILGRRRHIPDMMLKEFDFVPAAGYINPDIDPMDISTLNNSNDIPERIKSALYDELVSYKYFGQVVKRTKALLETDHIRVVNNTYKIQEASRQVINSMVQGSAADLTKLAIQALGRSVDWESLGGKLVLPVHDELIAEVPIDKAKEGGELLSKVMCEAASFLPFSINCDVTTSYRWYGLAYPCPYPQPETLSVTTIDSNKWIQYHLFECGYELPVIKGPNGEKPEGDEAQGINGIISEAITACIHNYCGRYNIQEDAFIDHIHTKVHMGTDLNLVSSKN